MVKSNKEAIERIVAELDDGRLANTVSTIANEQNKVFAEALLNYMTKENHCYKEQHSNLAKIAFSINRIVRGRGLDSIAEPKLIIAYNALAQLTKPEADASTISSEAAVKCKDLLRSFERGVVSPITPSVHKVKPPPGKLEALLNEVKVASQPRQIPRR